MITKMLTTNFVAAIHSLKVITGCGSHGTGRGRIKRAVSLEA